MGTSSSYKGSTSKVSRVLRDGVSDWAGSQDGGTPTALPESVIAQALKIPVFPRSSGGGGGGGGTGGGAAGGGGTPRSGKQSSPRRDARAYASTASRAAGLARAFREGDRAALEKAGLDFDKLSSMSTRSEMVRAILDVVLEAQTSSDIPTEEQRDMAGALLDWMLDTDQNPDLPDAAATSEHAIGLIVAEIFLSESGEFTSRDGLTREQFIDSVYDASQQLASRANMSDHGASQGSIDKAIESGLRILRRLYPGSSS